jgi:hypothetical protein
MHPIAIMVIWLSLTGDIDAQATGVADTVEHCKAIAAQAVTVESMKADSAVKGDKVLTLCYDTRQDAAKFAPVPTQPVQPPKPTRAPGSVDLLWTPAGYNVGKWPTKHL